ncbi:glucose-1-phosphate adenylyltransferase [Paenibacillus provencensis]|uniref:Glucose-1-phosphate adenylyltransferase n=1 Tax=Paenibacillus provencensis TaxID=441151 RepID=A0ABW3PM79_9BACL|nr:glucose-1-phosphate adenylyltransferase [Paenibacillus sp. MER 78]MCM3126725.1 glucose-1-phosphate adenylyltransferase [Paenibacillus sp. MER 78]
MAKKDCIAMLLAGGEGKRLAPLTSSIAKPAVHFGGNYRIIDFPLSNCVNSGIDTVGVLTQYEAESLHQHIGEGEPWKLNQTGGNGISLLPSWNIGCEEGYCGTADAIYKNIEFIDQHDPEDVLILSGDHIYQMDYRELLQYHTDKGAQATIAVIEVPWNEAHRFGVMGADEDMRVTEFVEKPAKPESNLASMGIYVFKWSYLKEHLLRDAAIHDSGHDFGKDLIPAMLQSEEPLYVYNFNGYWKDVGTVQSLWDAHMDLLNGVTLNKESEQTWPMFTRKWRTKPSAHKPRTSSFDSCMVHETCAIEGDADRSVIFYGVEIGKSSSIKDSVIMPNAKIGRNVTIEHAIIGEGAIVRDGAVIKGKVDEIVVIGPHETVVSKPAVRSQPNRLLKEVYEKTGRLRAEGLSS